MFYRSKGWNWSNAFCAPKGEFTRNRLSFVKEATFWSNSPYFTGKLARTRKARELDKISFTFINSICVCKTYQRDKIESLSWEKELERKIALMCAKTLAVYLTSNSLSVYEVFLLWDLFYFRNLRVSIYFTNFSPECCGDTAKHD